MAATGFTLDTGRAEQIGAQAEWLAEAADHGLPPGLHGCGAPRVVESWDDYLGALTRTWSVDLLPALALWGSAVKSTVAWVRARDHAIAGLSTGSTATIPGLDTIASTPTWTTYATTGHSGLTWEPGNPGLGQLTDTQTTGHWLDRFTDHTAEVAGRFGALIDELPGTWTGTLAETFIRLGRDLHHQLNQYATVLAYGYGGLALHQYTGQVEDIAVRASGVQGRLSDAHELLTLASSALNDLDEFDDLTPAQQISRTRALNTQNTADDDIRILAAALSHLDDERFDADNHAISAAHQSHDGLAQITATPPGNAHGSASTHVKPASPGGSSIPTVAAATTSNSPIAFAVPTTTESSGGDDATAVEPFPDQGLGPIGPQSCPVWTPARPLPHDPGAGEYDSVPWTPADWLNWYKTMLSAVGAIFVNWPNAASNLIHYLEGSGEDVSLPVSTMIESSEKFRATIETHWNQIVDSAITSASESMTTGPVTFPVRSEWFGFSFDPTLDRDWYLAVGSVNYCMVGDITVWPPSPTKPNWSFFLNYQILVDDRYNWDTGKATPIGPLSITDEQLGALHRAGFAQEFDMHGSSGASTERGTRIR